MIFFLKFLFRLLDLSRAIPRLHQIQPQHQRQLYLVLQRSTFKGETTWRIEQWIEKYSKLIQLKFYYKTTGMNLFDDQARAPSLYRSTLLTMLVRHICVLVLFVPVEHRVLAASLNLSRCWAVFFASSQMMLTVLSSACRVLLHVRAGLPFSVSPGGSGPRLGGGGLMLVRSLRRVCPMG